MSNIGTELTRIAGGDEAALIIGETGVGKELAARKVHDEGKRCGCPLVTVNCYDFTGNPDLARSELFGHTKGAFTGADCDKTGAIKAAGKGTLFLDEIGALPFDVQGKLLRAIEYRTYRRLGKTTDDPVECQIVAATNLKEDAVPGGRFGIREDLLYRFDAEIRIAPLRDRRS